MHYLCDLLRNENVGVLILVPIIQEKALSLNFKIPNSDPNFTACKDWLDR